MRCILMLAVSAFALFLSIASPGAEEREDAAPGELAAIDPKPSLKERSLVAFVHQTGSVRSSCFTPELRTLLGKLQSKFGRTIVVTSGFRPPNRARRGSYHRRCMAADIQIPGVPSSRVAAAARNLTGIGGVGTYCHTRSVHVDVGPRRDWSWGCGRRKIRKARG